MRSIVRSDPDGFPVLLELTEGLALRSGSRTRYVCPALFESDDAPRAVALSQGQALVVSSGGVFLLSTRGAVSRHPAPELLQGQLSSVAGSSGTALAVRRGAAGGELLTIGAEGARVIAELPAGLASLAVEDDAVLVAGLDAARRAVQRGFELDGADRQAWNAEAATPLDAVAVFARLSGGQPYLLVTARNGLGSELAQLNGAGSYRVVQRAGGAMSGPVVLGDRTWIAFDGRLAELRDGRAVVTDGPLVTCVGRSGDLGYACTMDGVARLEDGVVGELLFDLHELATPDLRELDPALAERCNLQWLRFRVDLAAAGIEPRDDGDGGTQDGGRRDAGSRPARDGGAEVAMDRDGGCAVAAVRADGDGGSTRVLGPIGWLLALACGVVRMRRRRR